MFHAQQPIYEPSSVRELLTICESQLSIDRVRFKPSVSELLNKSLELGYLREVKRENDTVIFLTKQGKDYLISTNNGSL